MGKLSLVTIIIIAANIIISFKGFNDYSFFERYKFNIGSIKRGEQIRLLSSGFLHVNQSHLFFNMLTLYFFANTVIYHLNSVFFLIIYIGSLLLGSLVSMYFNKNNYHYSAVGASGAVTGVLYAAILLEPRLEIYFLPAYVFGVGYLLYSIYGMKNQLGNIGHDAHFGGAVGGYLITLLLDPNVFVRHFNMIILLAIPIILLIILKRLGKL